MHIEKNKMIANEADISKEVMRCMYPLVKQVHNTSLSVHAVAVISQNAVADVKRVFEDLKAVGLLKRVYSFSSLYRLTDAGFVEVKTHWMEYQKKADVGAHQKAKR